MERKKQKREVTLPYKFTPRDYQLPVYDALNAGYKRIIQICHRRWGKDKLDLNILIPKLFERIGTYYYFFPTYSQGKKILWSGMDRDGFKFIDHFPKEIIKGKPNETEMKINLINGSVFQVIGTDNINSIVGTNPIGCIFSEYSLQDPAAWDFIRPILAENDGWAIFNFTPRGENHAYDLYKYAMSDPAKWAVIHQTVDDTKAIPREVLDQERKEIIAKHGNDAHYQQEYMCSFKVPIIGAYYSAQIMQAVKDNRFGYVPWDATKPVETWWDIGYGDSTAIWFSQQIGLRTNFIDYYELNGKGLPHYVKILQDKGYVYAGHNFPHDFVNGEFGSGKTRIQTILELGVPPTLIKIVPKTTIEYGVDRVRILFNQCWFDEKGCQRGIAALKNYHKKWDDIKKDYANEADKNWAIHGADAFRTWAVGYNNEKKYVKENNWGNSERNRAPQPGQAQGIGRRYY